MSLTLILLWIVATLFFVTVFAVVAKKHGVQFLTVAMALSILLANIANAKFVIVAGHVVPAGTIIFSMTFLISDVLSEFWGKKEAQKAVWAGFLGLLLYLAILKLTIAWPAPPFAIDSADKFEDLYALAPRIVLGSMVAYVISQNFDVWFYHKIKQYTKDKYLWLRNNLSTIVSQFLDSVIFFTIAFLGTAVFPTVASLVIPIMTLWLFKVAIAIVDTPFMYMLRWVMRKV